MYKFTPFCRHLLATFESLTGDVIRHAKTVLIRHAGDGKSVFMWNEHKLFFQTIAKIENTVTDGRNMVTAVDNERINESRVENRRV